MLHRWVSRCRSGIGGMLHSTGRRPPDRLARGRADPRTSLQRHRSGAIGQRGPRHSQERSKWTATPVPAGFAAVQAQRGRRRGEKRRNGFGAQGAHRHIAREMEIDQRPVSRWLAKLQSS